MPPVRTRFAPSPTGFLHIGGARTALYNWLYARRMGGRFILRIEDTDKERSTDENTRAILEGLTWLRIDWDEGPILQSGRTELYRRHVEMLLSKGKAYRCTCTKEELEEKNRRALADGRKPGYDRACRRRQQPPPAGRPFVVRIAFDEEGQTTVHDRVKGDVVFDNKELTDEVILRADGSPLYNLCVVVDDAEMKITHVLRGDDHLNNTPKQIQMYRAFGFECPEFGHMPLIFGPDKKKLSKRNNVVAVDAYREMGFLPEAMVNFLARLGWAHGDEEIFPIGRLREVFDIEGIGQSAGIYDLKKLENLNLHWIKTLPVEEVARRLVPYLEKRGWPVPDRETLGALVACTRERSRTLVEMRDQVAFLFVPEPAFDPKAVEKHLKGKAELLGEIASALERLGTFDNPTVETALKALAESRGGKMVEIAQPLRVALTGGTVSPPITDVVTLLGKGRTLERVAAARSVA